MTSRTLIRCQSRCQKAMGYGFLWLATMILLTGCSGQKRLIAEQQQTINTLQASENALQNQLYLLQDSLLFYERIDSGEYYRTQRTLEDRINKLEFLLAEGRDALCNAEPIDSFSVDALFTPASANLTDKGKKILDDLAQKLLVLSPSRRFRVESHSDSVPPGGKLKAQYPDNWVFSAARATAVIQYLIETHSLVPARFELVAFADTQPLATNRTQAGRRINRRIDILLIVNSE